MWSLLNRKSEKEIRLDERRRMVDRIVELTGGSGDVQERLELFELLDTSQPPPKKYWGYDLTGGLRDSA